MGGKTFENTKRLSNEEYSAFIDTLKELRFEEGKDFLLPFRLGNKESHGDIDLIVHDPDIIISRLTNVKEVKTVSLFEVKFNLFSKHVLTNDLIQIDFLVAWSAESLEVTRLFFSYSFVNIFLRKMITFFNINTKLNYLGLFITDSTFELEVNSIAIDRNTRLVVDCNYIFNIIELDYSRFVLGFIDEVELLNYLSSSRFFSLIEFKNNSKFKHDYKRLESFRKLVDSKLINMKK